MKVATEGPMRRARVEPIMRAIFLVGRGWVGEAGEAMVRLISVWVWTEREWDSL
jgi:hypothetical protein